MTPKDIDNERAICCIVVNNIASVAMDNIDYNSPIDESPHDDADNEAWDKIHGCLWEVMKLTHEMAKRHGWPTHGDPPTAAGKH